MLKAAFLERGRDFQTGTGREKRSSLPSPFSSQRRPGEEEGALKSELGAWVVKGDGFDKRCAKIMPYKMHTSTPIHLSSSPLSSLPNDSVMLVFFLFLSSLRPTESSSSSPLESPSLLLLPFRHSSPLPCLAEQKMEYGAERERPIEGRREKKSGKFPHFQNIECVLKHTCLKIKGGENVLVAPIPFVQSRAS